MERTLQVLDRNGPEDYSAALTVQTNLLEAKIADRDLSDLLVLVEHAPVYTVGRSHPFQDLSHPLAQNVKWVEVGRGGQATYHGPGQLVAYPIFDLQRHGKDVHIFIRKLELVGIDFLASFGIGAKIIPGQTGVWIDTAAGPKKLISIGIGVRKWVSYHGIAINISPDLEYFRAISACGLEGSSVSSLEELGASVPEMSLAKDYLVDSFKTIFDLELADPESEKTIEQEKRIKQRARPSWLKAKAPGSPDFQKTNEVVREHNLVTVCEEARCPNIGECWSHGTATFMIMGESCTRRCSFCSVKDGTLQTLDPLDNFEPMRVGQAVKRLGLKHVVITSVNRDDLPDMGAEHFDQTVRSIKNQAPDCDVEFLIPDMRGRRELVEKCLASGFVRVLNHNIETVPRLYREVRPGAVFRRSLDVLRWASEIQPDIRSKSGVMVGLGETKEEVLGVMDSLRGANVKVLTIGQYLQPSAKQLPVKRFVTPEEFAFYKSEGLKRGFLHVESGPLVRSSYHAWQHTGAPAPESAPAERSLASLV